MLFLVLLPVAILCASCGCLGAMGDSSSTFGIVMVVAMSPTAAIATGTPTACHVRSEAPTWVLDSGANDHMTDILLSSVLHVPNFAFNLLSVSRLAKSLNCAVIFLPYHCLLQDLNSKKIFGRGYERDGLYYFGEPPPTSGLQASILPHSNSNDVPFYSTHSTLQVSDLSPSIEITSPLARPVPIFDSMVPESSSPPVQGSSPPLQVYTRRSSHSVSPARLIFGPRFRYVSYSYSFYTTSTHLTLSILVFAKLLPDSYRAFIGKLESVSIPRSVSAALQDPKWVTAMQAEMNALQANQTWELVPLPAGEKIVGSSHSWPLHQLDIKNAFLHGDLLETIYMDTPPGFRAEGEYAGKVCRLRKSLYGLKQSPRAWFSRFSEVILSMEFVRCHSDHTCFIRRRLDGCCIILLVYVDDIILTGDDAPGISQVKQDLGKVFDVKDLGSLRYFLGIEVARSRNGISLSQRKYTLDLLQDTGMLGCRPASTPMDPNLKLSTESGLSCFTDADYAGSQTDRRSTTGLSTFYGNHLISWKSKK
uniref:Reverse transcriptase Ty1/copia-type domain-containing protein n=1 Tax=Fagus sylvatica TaxID=28930 RepID=A0A2N9EV06_FAGSY